MATPTPRAGEVAARREVPAGDTRLFAQAEAARVTSMLLLAASGSKGPVVSLADSLRIQAARRGRPGSVVTDKLRSL